MSKVGKADDRRQQWQPPARPEWLARLNELGESMDAKGIVPLDPDSLMAQAQANVGLEDFGDDEWIKHFRKLLEFIESEAQLTLFGRILTRSEFLIYLEARLNITDWYRRYPQIDDEVIDEPVFITGFGRSGTTILQEVLIQDPQFRSVRKWEGLFPCPPPEEGTYDTDPRIAKAQAAVDLIF